MKQLVFEFGLPSGPSLDNFCPGPNEAALRHCQRWLETADQASASWQPTYVWGGPACGKTHLLKALRTALQERGLALGWLDPAVQVPPEFDERWQAVFLDDVQAFNAGQQQAAFKWFVNAQGHQIAVWASGDAPPARLPLREDLRSRLAWGQVFALQPLSEPEQRAVLRQAAQARGITLSNEVMDFMLTRFSRDLGSLMELLNLLDGYALQTQRHITIPLIKSMLENE